MPNHKSAIKRVRQNEKRNLINRGHRARLRTAIKKLRSAIAAHDGATAQQLLSDTVSRIDKSVQKGAIHRNAAARYKSRLTKHVSAVAAA